MSEVIVAVLVAVLYGFWVYRLRAEPWTKKRCLPAPVWLVLLDGGREGRGGRGPYRCRRRGPDGCGPGPRGRRGGGEVIPDGTPGERGKILA